MRPEVSLTVLAAWLAGVSASSLSLGPLPRTEHDLTENVDYSILQQRPTEPEKRLSPFPVSQSSSTDASGAMETGRDVRLFFPRRNFASTCVTVSNQLSETIDSQLNNVLETLNSNNNVLTDGQVSILQAISGISTCTDTGTACDLSGLETGQMGILTAISNLGTDLDQLNDIQTDIETAKNMILSGQNDINGGISDLDGDVETVKTMILDGQTGINNNIDTVSGEVETGKTMILDGQTSITSDISDLSSALSSALSMILAAISDLDTDISTVSTDLSVAKTMILDGQTSITNDIAAISTQLTTTGTNILAELSTIEGKVDALETGQQEICDKIEALDAKLDTIIEQLNDRCPDGATLNNNQCFTLSQTQATYADAVTACQTMGGNLATMTADNAAVLYGLADGVSGNRAWIGLTMASGSWAWEDGSAYGAFTDWQGAEPTSPVRQCGEAMSTSSTEGFWRDRRCTRTRFYICQTPAS